MGKLTAVFLVHLPNELYVQRLLSKSTRNHLIGNLGYDVDRRGEIALSTRDFLTSLNLKYEARINEFDIVVFLIPTSSWEQGVLDDETMFTVSSMQIEVSHVQEVEPPNGEIQADPSSKLPPRLEYFDAILPPYQETAFETINRVIRYFKYRLQNPLLNDTQNPTIINMPIWKDENGQVIQLPYGAKWHIVFHSIPGELNALGRRNLSINEDISLVAAIENPEKIELYEELLSDAQSAAVDNKLRRAVLELAIACEVIIYQTFFGESSPASEVFDFLVVEKYVQIAPKDLIHKVAKRAFGESFKDKYPQHWNDIDHLFSCRNKVAHRGQLKYVSNEKTIEVDRKIFSQWWQSVDVLIKWLKEQSDK